MDRRQKNKRADMEYKREKTANVSIKDRDDADMATSAEGNRSGP